MLAMCKLLIQDGARLDGQSRMPITHSPRSRRSRTIGSRQRNADAADFDVCYEEAEDRLIEVIMYLVRRHATRLSNPEPFAN